VRAGLAPAAIVALHEWMPWAPLMQAALAALLTCLADPGGPVRRRLPSTIAFSVLGALVTVAWGLLRDAPLALVVPIACLGIFVCAFARAFGQAPMQVGNLLTVAQVLALTRPIHSASEAVEVGAAFLGGAGWAALLTLVLWRVHPFRPARRAVAAAYLALAELAADLRALLRGGSRDPALWEAHMRAQRRQAREAIEQAREALLAIVRTRGSTSARAAQGWIRLEAVEQMFGTLIGLSALLEETQDASVRAGAERMLRLLRPALVLLAHGIETDTVPRLGPLERAAA
jgi:hypothetical protein